MSKNVFKLFEEENESFFTAHEMRIKNSISERKDIWSHFADIAEMYVPRLVSAILGVKDKNKTQE